MTSKVEIFSQNLAFREGGFDQFQAKKRRFVDIQLVVCELFGCDTKTIFDLQGPLFRVLFKLNTLKYDLCNRNLGFVYIPCVRAKQVQGPRAGREPSPKAGTSI